MRNVLYGFAVGLASALAFVASLRAASPANLDWPAYLGDKGRSLYSPLQQINRTNVAQLKVAWRRQIRSAAGGSIIAFALSQ